MMTSESSIALRATNDGERRIRTFEGECQQIFRHGGSAVAENLLAFAFEGSNPSLSIIRCPQCDGTFRSHHQHFTATGDLRRGPCQWIVPLQRKRARSSATPEGSPRGTSVAHEKQEAASPAVLPLFRNLRRSARLRKLPEIGSRPRMATEQLRSA